MTLNPPILNSRSNIELSYRDSSDNILDISSSGRGLQQVILLLGYMLLNEGATILLDEPDAHLEIIRQRNIYNQIQKLAAINNNQIIIASHSEIIMNEAAAQDSIIAFIGKTPYKINDKGSQLIKSLASIGFEDYYQAEKTGYILYLEGSTDKSILEAYAEKLLHPSYEVFKNGFIKYTSNNLPSDAKTHFYGIKAADSKLRALAIFDKLEKEIENKDDRFFITTWERRELENYFFNLETLRKYVTSEIVSSEQLNFVELQEQKKKVEAMEYAIELIIPKIAQNNNKDSFWIDTKASEQLERIFELYFKKLELPIKLSKKDYYKLIFSNDHIDNEIIQKLDLISSKLLTN